MAAKWRRSCLRTDCSSDSAVDSSLNNNRCRVGWFRTLPAFGDGRTDTAAGPSGTASGSLAAGCCKLSALAGKLEIPMRISGNAP